MTCKDCIYEPKCMDLTVEYLDIKAARSENVENDCPDFLDKNQHQKDLKKFAEEIISEIMSQWGCDPQYYVNSNNEVEAELARNDVALIQMIELRLKDKFMEWVMNDLVTSLDYNFDDTLEEFED